MSRRVLIDMTGVRHGRLVGISMSHRGPFGHAHWHFVCDCGTLVTADASRVRSGNTTSCGCRHREISAARLLVHGHRAARRHDQTYCAWQAMKNGCYNSSSDRFTHIGRRGIRVCPEWRNDYERFLADMGRRPAGTTLERLDTNSDYGKANCIWRATDTRSTRAMKGWERRRSAEGQAATHRFGIPGLLSDSSSEGRAENNEA